MGYLSVSAWRKCFVKYFKESAKDYKVNLTLQKGLQNFGRIKTQFVFLDKKNSYIS